MTIRFTKEKQTFDDYVKTEEIIIRNLTEKKDLISDDFELLPFPFAVLINNHGVQWVNNFLSNLPTEKRRVVVCQHIWAEHLKLEPQDILCTPHATLNSFSVSIGHQPVNIDLDFYKNERTIEFSFVGSLGTHDCRKKLKQLFPENVYDPGVGWGLDKNVPTDIKRNYIQILGNSNFSLCPRGTGVSTVRLFECMGMGSIPIIIADGYKLPLSKLIDWENISISIQESEMNLIPDRIQNFKLRNPNLSKVRFRINEFFQKYFCDENLHLPIVAELAGNLE